MIAATGTHDVWLAEDEIEWLITRRVRCAALLGAWPAMSARERERATRQLAAALRAFHAAPADGLDGDFEPPHTPPLVPLLELARDPEVEAFVRARWPVFDDRNVGLVHGDPHLESVLWDGEQIWLIDLEWSRRSWLECDLEILLSVADHPTLFAAADYEVIGDHREMPRWLRDEYPAWFAHPRLRERLELLFVSRTLGLTHGWGPAPRLVRGPGGMPAVNRLRRSSPPRSRDQMQRSGLEPRPLGTCCCGFPRTICRS
jgi:hypothetical protein